MCVLYQDFDADSLCFLRFECQVAQKNAVTLVAFQLFLVAGYFLMNLTHKLANMRLANN